MGQVEQALGPGLTGTEQLFIGSYLLAACEACRPAADRRGLRAADRHGVVPEPLSSGHPQRSGARPRSRSREAIREGHSILDIYVDVFQESLYQVGRLGSRTRFRLPKSTWPRPLPSTSSLQTYAEFPASDRRRGNVVLTGVAGELHQVGENMVADILEAEGYDVHFGYERTPSGVFWMRSRNTMPTCSASPATMLFNIPCVVQLVSEVRARFGARQPRIVLGGAAFRSYRTRCRIGCHRGRSRSAAAVRSLMWIGWPRARAGWPVIGEISHRSQAARSKPGRVARVLARFSPRLGQSEIVRRITRTKIQGRR